MAKQDPYLLDPNEMGKLRKENEGTSLGIICPKRNKSIGGICAVCDKVAYLFGTGDAEDKEIALNKMAKVNFYMNIVFPHNPDKSTVLEVGKKVGNQIIKKIEEGKWLDIAHPKADIGREMEISKSKGDMGYNVYTASPVLEKANWDIPDEVLKSLPNLDEIINLLPTLGEEDGSLFKISSIKLDETLTFRICPPAHGARPRIMNAVWRHWGGVTQDEIEGKVEMNLNLPEPKSDDKEKTDTPAPWESDTPAPQETTEPRNVTQPHCFGQEAFFEMDDPECRDKCDFYKSCGRSISKAA